MRILVVEDDPRLGPSLKKGLERNHYAVDLAIDGEEALLFGQTVPYDLIVLDVLLPGLNGFEVCRQLRREKRTMPILLLTALGEVDHRVTGLDMGADDYLTKPFAFRELEARIRALLRRESPTKTMELHFMDIILDTSTHEVRRGERVILLGSKEYALLEFRMRHPCMEFPGRGPSLLIMDRSCACIVQHSLTVEPSLGWYRLANRWSN